MERKLVAILAADVVGYSALMEADEAGTFAQVQAGRKELFEPEILKHHGRVFKLMGDGLLAEFGSVVDAVECAVALQRGMLERNASVPEDRRIEVRIGINLGEVIVEGEDRYGEGVNIAARLQQLAEPGGICVSGKVSKEVERKLAFSFEPMGEQRMKNIAEAISCYRVNLRARRPDRPSNAPGKSPKVPDGMTIAVLPFSNMSSDPEQEYFSDGISEDIITDLAKLSELHVIARNSSFVYKSRTVPVPDVARELGVRYVLEGSVRKAGNRVRVTAQLIDSTTGGHIWAERFDRDLTDIFAVQDELTRQIVSALKVTLTVKDQVRLSHKPGLNIEAYELFLRGREQTWLHTKMGNAAARDLFGRAAAIVPDYAAAHALTAFTHSNDYSNGWGPVPEQSLLTGREIAERAVAMDEDEPLVHFALAVAYTLSRDLDRAIAEADRCIALSPNSAEGHLAKAHPQIFSGDPAGATATIATYMRLDPFFPDVAWYFLAEAHFSLGEYGQAACALERRIERNPQSATSHALLASCYGWLGRLEESRKAWAKVNMLDPEFSIERRRRVLPFRNPEEFERRVEGLRKAGLPE